MHPRLFQFGHLVLPTYGVLLALGLILSLLVCLRTASLLSLPVNKVWNLALLAVVVTIAGAKLLFMAVNWPLYGMRVFGLSFSSAPSALLWGIAAAIAGCWIYAWRVHLPIRRTADALAPALAVGNAIASIACLESGCDYGTPTHLPWAVIYTDPYAPPDTPRGVPLHPTQLYSSVVEFALFVLLLWLLYRPHRDGEIAGAWLFLAGLSKFFLGFLMGDGGGGELLGGLLTVSQAIAAGMVLLGACLWLRQENAHRPDARRSDNRPDDLEAHHAG